jgi:membrane fusion protein (multidrug efflux system)
VQTTNDAYVRGEITDVSSRVSGYAVDVLFDDGMPVKAADVVVAIDPRDLRMAVEKAEAALNQAKADLASVVASLELGKSKVAVAQAALRSAEAQAKDSDITLTRASILAKDRFGTQAALDDAQAAEVKAHSAVDQATANLAYQNQELVVINANVGVAKARVDSAEAALLSAKFALTDTAVWAPLDGIVANRKVRVGEYVASGTPMLSIVPIQNLWVEANYRETQIGGMKIGDPVRIDMDIYPNRPVCGYIEAVLPAAGAEFALVPPDNATGNFTKIVRRFTVRIRFDHRDANAGLARPGMSVETAVAVSTPDQASSAELGNRVGCTFDPAKDMPPRTLTKLPEHPGLGRARPQGPTGIGSLRSPIPSSITIEEAAAPISVSPSRFWCAGIIVVPLMLLLVQKIC